MDRWVGVLLHARAGGGEQAPEARPVGRAALALAAEGIGVVFGDELHQGRISGWVATPGAWEQVEDVAVLALHDRFPSQTRPARYRELMAQRAAVPMGNSEDITLLCRDKLRSQRFLEGRGLDMPELVAIPERFERALQSWGAGFRKPRFGALGRGVQRVVPGDPLPATCEGAVFGVQEPMLLQRAVPPPAGWSGWSLRVLVQRLPGGGWQVASRVLRRSRTDPVVNVARGAEVGPAAELLDASQLQRLDELAVQVAQVLGGRPQGELTVELGVDAVVDDQGEPHLVEVNSRPRGRLEALAEQQPERFAEAHVQACARPLRYLAWLAGQG